MIYSSVYVRILPGSVCRDAIHPVFVTVKSHLPKIEDSSLSRCQNINPGRMLLTD